VVAMTRAEREHIVRFSDDPDEPLTVYTHKERLAKRLLRAGGTLKRESKIEGQPVSWTVECPREWFREPRPRRKRNTAISEETRARLGERLSKARMVRRNCLDVRATDTEGAS